MPKNWECGLCLRHKYSSKNRKTTKNDKNHDAKKIVVQQCNQRRKKQDHFSESAEIYGLSHKSITTHTHTHKLKKAKCINVYRHDAVRLDRKYRKGKQKHTRQPEEEEEKQQQHKNKQK